MHTMAPVRSYSRESERECVRLIRPHLSFGPVVTLCRAPRPKTKLLLHEWTTYLSYGPDVVLVDLQVFSASC